MALPIEPPLRAMSRTSGRRARPPRMAEVVANGLRDAILRGELTEVPRLEDLVEQFNAGAPAVREAMRILETEGLITIRRGNTGGADVHRPSADQVAATVALVLQSKQTALRDVGEALRQLEPVCAGMCAARGDRKRKLVPALRRLLAEQADAIGDVQRTLGIVDRFHETLVHGCGNDTLTVVVGALERLWAGHAGAVYGTDRAPDPPPVTVWRAALREHERITNAIERGDVKEAEELARRHLEATHAYMSNVDDTRKVTAESAVPR